MISAPVSHTIERLRSQFPLKRFGLAPAFLHGQLTRDGQRLVLAQCHQERDYYECRIVTELTAQALQQAHPDLKVETVFKAFPFYPFNFSAMAHNFVVVDNVLAIGFTPYDMALGLDQGLKVNAGDQIMKKAQFRAPNPNLIWEPIVLASEEGASEPQNIEYYPLRARFVEHNNCLLVTSFGLGFSPEQVTLKIGVEYFPLSDEYAVYRTYGFLPRLGNLSFVFSILRETMPAIVEVDHSVPFTEAKKRFNGRPADIHSFGDDQLEALARGMVRRDWINVAFPFLKRVAPLLISSDSHD